MHKEQNRIRIKNKVYNALDFYFSDSIEEAINRYGKDQVVYMINFTESIRQKMRVRYYHKCKMTEKAINKRLANYIPMLVYQDPVDIETYRKNLRRLQNYIALLPPTDTGNKIAEKAYQIFRETGNIEKTLEIIKSNTEEL